MRRSYPCVAHSRASRPRRISPAPVQRRTARVADTGRCVIPRRAATIAVLQAAGLHGGRSYHSFFCGVIYNHRLIHYTFFLHTFSRAGGWFTDPEG